ncbi:DUF6476 family protein [Primorskyibacter aestuariivivens]|uniref:DUF6476 family protein n=1 Tax=Primorskyibacter aestuariivivens TaxID=1888912 RepID=UPI0023015E1F|nr:DUF6476 family protein [Primorskyibacter aestuariivivens]MDA7427119.1 DUF6476 family protein [Primorskyibacter aestuariivivens]
MNMAPDEHDDLPEPSNLRFLRVLVTVLTGVMIGGVILIIVLIVIRFRDPGPQVPEDLTLPADVTPQAVTFGTGWVAVVTDDDRILIFDRVTGRMTQEVAVTGN